MVIKKIKKLFTSFSGKFKSRFNPMSMAQNAMMKAMGLKPKSRIEIFFQKLLALIIRCNDRLLNLADKIASLYKQYIQSKPRMIWSFLKNIIFVFLLANIKKLWIKIVDFYKKDKAKAIIYFIILYLVYKFAIAVLSKISNIFSTNRNTLTVLARRVEPEKAKKDVNCYGYLESENNLNYQSEVRGNVEKIFVKEKQMVKEGQLLMILDSKFTANSYVSMKSILETKKLQYGAIKKLYEQGLESKGNLKNMEADLENANSNFESIKKAYNGLVVKAPFDGYIDNITKKEGSQINTGDLLFTLERTDAMQVKCDVQNLLVDEVEVGEKTRIYLGGNEMAYGKLAVIGDSIDVYSGSRSILVNNIKSIEGFEDYVKPGVSVMMKLEAKAQKDVYKISAEALETTPTGAFMVKVLNKKNKTVVAKNIIVYNEIDGLDYVFGLEDGDLVIERGHEFVDVGEKDIKYSVLNDKKEGIFKRAVLSIKKAFSFLIGEIVEFVKDFPELAIYLKDITVKYSLLAYNTVIGFFK